MNPILSRRCMLQSVSSGFGYLAFSALAHRQAMASSASPLAPKQPHFAPRAKRVIFLCMNGGPSHVDTFDHKPKLQADDGKTAPSLRGYAKLMASPWKFSQHGKSGLWISELFPHVARHADELCLLRGMHTDLPAHPQAFLKLHTGSFQFVRPSLGSWALYGLGTENDNLPGFVSINPTPTNGGSQNYGSAFLPAIYQGTPVGGGFRSNLENAKLPNIANPKWTTPAQRAQLDFIQSLNRQRLSADQVNPQIEGVIESYELAFRMQSQVPKVMDTAAESKATLDLYGIDDDQTESFGRACLLARRFAEAGVRFIEITHSNWDHHRNLQEDLQRNCGQVDRPIAALLTDLKQRGMLKDTLVMWGGEFGRTPGAQNNDGRDHNNKGFTLWMAGGGVKGGFSYGQTDDYGAEAVIDRMHIHDWHATILHLLGLDHEKLTHRYAGRDFRLTDVHGHVAHEILA
jgi:hypothetical protein